MKYAMLALVLVSLAACKTDERESERSESGRTYRVECVEGVEYWVRTNGYRGYMAPRINAETLTFVRCGEVK